MGVGHGAIFKIAFIGVLLYLLIGLEEKKKEDEEIGTNSGEDFCLHLKKNA